ncbi:MAG: hypothetical protein WCX88_01820, partial [Patescibacteria group bacterium]
MDKSNKNYILKTLMSSPTTSKLLQEAWASPIGSTSRAKTKAILKSLKNTSSVDGKGGPASPFVLGTNSSSNPFILGTNSSVIGTPSDVALKNYSPFLNQASTTQQNIPSNMSPAPETPKDKTDFGDFKLKTGPSGILASPAGR